MSAGHPASADLDGRRTRVAAIPSRHSLIWCMFSYSTVGAKIVVAVSRLAAFGARRSGDRFGIGFVLGRKTLSVQYMRYVFGLQQTRRETFCEGQVRSSGSFPVRTYRCNLDIGGGSFTEIPDPDRNIASVSGGSIDNAVMVLLGRSRLNRSRLLLLEHATSIALTILYVKRGTGRNREYLQALQIAQRIPSPSSWCSR